MKFDPKTPPREFSIGKDDAITIQDCGTLALDPDQQVTLVTENGAEYDVTRKDFGFYAMPSTNSRLRDHGFRTALVRNPMGKFFVMLVEATKEKHFHAYLTEEKADLVCWLDRDEHLARIVACMKDA